MDKRKLGPADVRLLRELAVTDHDFLRFVRSASHLGYGRMMHIIEREWYRAAQEQGNPTSGVLVVNTCLGLMPTEDQESFIAGYESDPLFGKTREK